MSELSSLVELNNISLHASHFVHSSVMGHLGCSGLLGIVNAAAVNMGIQISVRVPTFSSVVYVPRIRIA